MRPPLTREQLIEIRDRNHGHEDVATLRGRSSGCARCCCDRTITCA
jgi:hypothetical protein